MSKHSLECNAPICQESCDDEVVWLPGELVCKLEPLSWMQKKQININNLLKMGKYRLKDTALTAKTLKLR